MEQLTCHDFYPLAVDNLDLLLASHLQGLLLFLQRRFWIVNSHVSDEVSFMPEMQIHNHLLIPLVVFNDKRKKILIRKEYNIPKRPLTFWALMRLLLRRWRNVRWIVVEITVPFQELLLPERLVTVVALIWFLICVNKHVALEMARRYRSVRTEIAFVTLLALVRFAVQFVAIPKFYVQN